MTSEQAIALRTKMLGVLIKDARLASGKSLKECGESIGVSGGIISSYEVGRRSPSLPELEILTYFFNLPLEHFWSTELKSRDSEPISSIPITQLISLRTNIIAALLRKSRKEMRFTLKELSEKTGISSTKIKNYEHAVHPIPLPELELLARALDYTLEDFTNRKGPISEWITQQRSIQGYLELPDDLIEFVGKPVNHPYIELARKLSDMSAEKIREVAEMLLEISI